MSEATPEDVQEQQATPTRDAAAPPAVGLPAEADPADVAEQAAATGPQQHAADRELPLEADEADAAEQALVVELDEDEHR